MDYRIRCDDEGVPCIVQDAWQYGAYFKARYFDNEIETFYDHEVELLLGKKLREADHDKIMGVVEVLAERKYWRTHI